MLSSMSCERATSAPIPISSPTTPASSTISATWRSSSSPTAMRPYHDLGHTICVTLVGQEVLRGKHLREGGVSPRDWLHFITSLLCHDIGYVRGICRNDRQGCYVTGQGKE